MAYCGLPLMSWHTFHHVSSEILVTHSVPLDPPVHPYLSILYLHNVFVVSDANVPVPCLLVAMLPSCALPRSQLWHGWGDGGGPHGVSWFSIPCATVSTVSWCGKNQVSSTFNMFIMKYQSLLASSYLDAASVSQGWFQKGFMPCQYVRYYLGFLVSAK